MRILLFLILIGTVAIARGQSVKSIEEIRAEVTAGEYRSALTTINRQLLESSNELNRYALLMLKGESQLQLKDRLGAITTFQSASKAASNTSEMAAARANALIVERSMMGIYVPRRGARAQDRIDILAMDSRKEAMLALCDELWSEYKPQIDGAVNARQLPPIEKAFIGLADIHFLTLYATGQADETDRLMRELGGRAFELMQLDVKRLAARADYLIQLANSSDDDKRGWDRGRTGLTSQQRNEAKEMLEYLNRIRERATQYRQIAGKLGGDEARWSDLVADTVVAMTDAQSLYNDR